MWESCLSGSGRGCGTTGVWQRYCGTVGKPDVKQRTQTSRLQHWKVSVYSTDKQPSRKCCPSLRLRTKYRRTIRQIDEIIPFARCYPFRETRNQVNNELHLTALAAPPSHPGRMDQSAAARDHRVLAHRKPGLEGIAWQQETDQAQRRPPATPGG